MRTSEKDKQKKPARLPYEAPAVISEEVFETQALTCGKGPEDFPCIAAGTTTS